jgi:replicative DNA helicase
MPTLSASDLASLDRVPPQNLEAEMAVLGSMLLEEDALVSAAEVVTEDVFYKDAHRKIFAAMVELYRRDVPVDLVTLTDELTKRNVLDDVGGPSYLTTLVGVVPTAANVEHYCHIVKAKATLRSLIKATTRIATECYEEVTDPAHLLDKAEQRIFEIAQDKIKRDAVAVKQIVKDQIEVINALYENKGVIHGVPTGFQDLDQMLAGLHPAELIIVAGRPAMGKSSLAMGLAENAAMLYKTPVAVFSLEMSKENLVQRMLCSHARIDAHKVRTGMLAATDWPRLTEAAGKLSDAPIFIDDTPGVTILELRARARRLKSRTGLGMVILDYLQLMEEPGHAENRQQEIATISRSLKALARELEIPVVAVSQLSRAPERRDSFRPRLSDLRESGAIEQDADVVLLLYRDDYYNQNSDQQGVAEVIVAKQRNGPTGSIKLTFIKEFTRFESLAHGHQ